MRIFADSADVEEIKKLADLGFISGATTNPTLIAKAGGEPGEIYAQLANMLEHVSAEVVAEDADGMYREGRELSSIHPNIVVKIPFTPEGLKAVRRLKADGVRVNVTLIFSAAQALIAARVGADFVSPFIGRIDDIGYSGVDVIRQTAKIFTLHDISTQIIAASIRHPAHFIEAALSGAHIGTVPPAVIWKLLKHPLTDIGLRRFLEDWRKLQESKGK
ncbi:MAG: fructose-6-phosphate aldolase [Thermotogae bacterium]|nr:fructose-6-phosphate aldolase [Thermotogota bacterium]